MKAVLKVLSGIAMREGNSQTPTLLPKVPTVLALDRSDPMTQNPECVEVGKFWWKSFLWRLSKEDKIIA